MRSDSSSVLPSTRGYELNPAALRRWAIPAALAFSYFLTGKIGLKLALINPSATTVWPPAGIALFAFLVVGYEVWPVILMAAFAANLTTSGSVPAAVGIAVGDTLEGFLGAYLVIRFANGRRAFQSYMTVFKYSLCAGVLSTMVGATIGTLVLGLSGLAPWTDFKSVWSARWSGDAGGVMVVAPLLILWSVRPRLARTRGAIADYLLLLLGVAALGVLAYQVFSGGLWGCTWALVAIPVLAWSASQFAPYEVASATFIFAVFVIWGTLRDPVQLATLSLHETLVLLQVYLGAVAVTTLTISAVVSERKRDEEQLRASRDELEGQIYNRTAELRKLGLDLLHSQDNDRRRLAGELHDGVAQNLVALKMNLEIARDRNPVYESRVPKALDSALQLTDAALQEIRTLSYLLYPPPEDGAGLRRRIPSYGEGFARRSGIEVVAKVDDQLGRLPMEVEAALFRVVQEGLINIHRHSKSPTATITLETTSSGIALEIRDEGVGISPKDLAQKEAFGVGLRAMKETMGLIGGQLEIKPANPGTIVRALLSIPGLGPGIEASPNGNQTKGEKPAPHSGKGAP